MSPAVVPAMTSLDVGAHMQDMQQRLKQIAENLREELFSQTSQHVSPCHQPCTGDDASVKNAVDMEVQTSASLNQAVRHQEALMGQGTSVSVRVPSCSTPSHSTSRLSAAALSCLPGQMHVPTDTTYSVSEHLTGSVSQSGRGGSTQVPTASCHSAIAASVDPEALSMSTASVASNAQPPDERESHASPEPALSDVHSTGLAQLLGHEIAQHPTGLFKWFQREAEEQHSEELARMNEGIDKTCRATKRALAQIRAAKQKLLADDPQHADLDHYENWLHLNIEQSQAGIEQRRTLLQQQLEQQQLFWRFLGTVACGGSVAGAVSAQAYHSALRLAVGDTGGSSTALNSVPASAGVLEFTDAVVPEVSMNPEHAAMQGRSEPPTSISSVDYSLEYDSQTQASWAAGFAGDAQTVVSVHSISSSIAAEDMDIHPGHHTSARQHVPDLAIGTSRHVLACQVEELRAQVARKEGMKVARDAELRLQQELRALSERNACLDEELAVIPHCPDTKTATHDRDEISVPVDGKLHAGKPFIFLCCVSRFLCLVTYPLCIGLLSAVWHGSFMNPATAMHSVTASI